MEFWGALSDNQIAVSVSTLAVIASFLAMAFLGRGGNSSDTATAQSRQRVEPTALARTKDAKAA